MALLLRGALVSCWCDATALVHRPSIRWRPMQI